MNKCPSTRKSCLTEQGAKVSAVKFSKNSINGRMKAYKCPFCDWWHLTHQKQRL